MRFKDIPQFTREGSYEVDFELDRIEHTIDRYKSEYNLDMDPDFQRGHVWTEEKQIAYIEFILRGGRSARVIYFNCPGWMGNFDGPFVLVDGKQRLQAALRFVRGEIPAFGLYLSQYSDTPPHTAGFRFNINNLKTRRQVLQWYLDLNTGGVIHTTEEIEKVRRLLAAET